MIAYHFVCSAAASLCNFYDVFEIPLTDVECIIIIRHASTRNKSNTCVSAATR